MTSIEQDRASTASGINNAVARVADRLAVAVLRAVMIAAFGHSLRDSLVGQHLDANVVHDLESNAVKLGSLDVPQIKMRMREKEFKSRWHKPSFSVFES